MTMREAFPLGNYDIDTDPDHLKSGRFGVVYPAVCRVRGIKVALKHIAGGRNDTKVVAEERGAILQDRFALRYPDIVPQVYEYGPHREGYWIAMEWLDGTPLNAYRDGRDIDHREAARVARWIAGDFLARLHEFNRDDTGTQKDVIVHGDLKPEHVFVREDGSLRVIDFGITKAIQDTSTVNPFASVPYASPRRLRDGVVDRDADFWALGVMLYELIAGALPYHGMTSDAMSRAIQRQDPMPPLTCDSNLAAIVRKLLAPQREQSYQSGSTIAADLDAFLAGETPGAVHEQISTSVPTVTIGSQTRGARRALNVATVPTDHLPFAASEGAAPIDHAAQPAAGAPVRRPTGFQVRAVLAVLAVLLVLSEGAVWIRAEGFRSRIGLLEASSIDQARQDLDAVRRWSLLGVAVPVRVTRPLTDRLLTLADRPILDFRTEFPTVMKPQWEQARAGLELARELRPGHHTIAAKLHYVRGQLARIAANGRPSAEERSRLEEALTEFRQAATLDPSLPDPYLGMARIHAYGIRDFDALMNDLREAEARGYREGRRERAQIGDAYRFRAERARQRANRATGDERLRLLREAADDYQNCVAKFIGLEDFLDSDQNLERCRTMYERMLLEIDRQELLEDRDGIDLREH